MIRFIRMIAIAALFALTTTTLLGENNGVSVQVKGNIAKVSAPQGNVQLEFCTADMVRIRKSTNGQFEPNESWMVIRYQWEPVKVKSTQGKDYVQFSTDSLELKIFSNSWHIEIADKKGNLLFAEKSTENFKADSVVNTCRLAPDEHFFGFGERMDFMDQRGKKVYLNVELGRGTKPAVGGKNILKANYCPVPFFMSTKGYGIFFHNAFPTEWDMGWSDSQHYSFKAFGGEMDYYFIRGPKFTSILDSYTSLTGKTPLLPKFALGLHMGTYSGGTWGHEKEANDAYVVELCRKLRASGIPVDLFWLDSTWRKFNNKSFGNGGTTFEFQDKFLNPKAMFDSLYAMHIKMVGLHIRSIVDNGDKSNLLDQAIAAKVNIPNAGQAGLINFFDTTAVNWWWNNGVMKIASLGAKFVKTDVGGAYRIEKNASFLPGQEPARLHNLFPIAYAKAPFEKFQQYNGIRGLDHTREGYAGIQRYPFIWAGDWGTEWQWFEPVIRGGLNIGMSGVGSWTHCMGGFEQYSPYDTELYTRWVQFGMFSPIAILFGMDHPYYHEPWHYGKEALANFIKYDSLRYTLIPYLYSSTYEMSKTGRPVMSALVLDYQNDENVYSISDQYLFGKSMMVCPVTTKGALSRSIYLPGGEWFDYNTGQRYSGRQYFALLTPLDVLPIFVKGGAIIPSQPAMQYVDEKPVDLLTVDVYPAGKSDFDLYEDDGLSLAYQKGEFAITKMESNLSAAQWSFTIASPKGRFTPSPHGYLIKSYLDTTPTTVTENGIALTPLASQEAVLLNTGWFYDTTNKRLWIKTSHGNNKPLQLTAKF